MSGKHTPGPWHWPHDSNDLCPVDPDPTRSAVSSILTAEGGYGFLGSSNADTLAELDADRRLIAAAPDLLTSLQALDRAASDLCMAGNMTDAQQAVRVLNAELQRSRAAIAMATGSAE